MFFHNPFDPLEFNEKDSALPRKSASLTPPHLLTCSQKPSLIRPGLCWENELRSRFERKPLATSLFAPKNTVRNGPKNKKPRNPRLPIWVLKVLPGLFPKLRFVEWAVATMIELVQSLHVNPNYGFQPPPTTYPQVAEVLLLIH